MHNVYYIVSIFQEVLLCRKKNHDGSMLTPTLFSLFFSCFHLIWFFPLLVLSWDAGFPSSPCLLSSGTISASLARWEHSVQLQKSSLGHVAAQTIWSSGSWGWLWVLLRREGVERPAKASCLGADSAWRQVWKREDGGASQSTEHQKLQSHNVSGNCIWIWSWTCIPVLCRNVIDKHERIWDCKDKFHPDQLGWINTIY